MYENSNLSQIDSFASILFPGEPDVWKTRFTEQGELEKSLLADWKGPRPSYVTEDKLESWKAVFMKNGFEGPTCWYRNMVSGFMYEDDQRT